jgi:hypothetical protein
MHYTVILSNTPSVEPHFVALPIQLKVRIKGLFEHRRRYVSTADVVLAVVTFHDVPIHPCARHIHDCSDPVPLFRLEIDILLPVLLADGPVVTIVADTVHFLEAELLLLAFLGYDPDDDVIVLDQNYPHVKVVHSLKRKSLPVVELISRTV